jgi:UDP-N-acetylglucosamine kinase
MKPGEQAIRDAALAFARTNKKERCSALTDPSIYLPEENPVSVFMAGSAGAGKTESSKELVAELEQKAPGSKILRIDPDDLRAEFPGYTGDNSWLFQGAVSAWVDRMLDLAYSQSQSFILDGTLSDLQRARSNINRSLKRNRKVQILYVYQDPLRAWEFVQARETEEGRHIPVDVFAAQYFQAREVVNALKVEFGAQIGVDLLLRPKDGSGKLVRVGVDKIDNHVPEKYGREELATLLGIQS